MDDSAIHADGGRAAPGATPAAAPLLTVEGLSISFATPKLDREGGANLVRAVRGVSFEMRPGETLALVGESGSGKSVTALAAARLLPSAARLEGSVRYDGLEILEASEGQLREIRGAEMSYIFQEPMTSLNPLHTIEQQINETLRIHQGLDGDDARARVLSLLHQVGVRDPESRLGAYPHQLSGGQRQRVMIAMALANEPKLLIADEPTTALDVTIQAQILTLLKQLQTEKGMAMLFITHDLGVVRRIADRVAVMQHGEIVETGPTERLFEAPAHPYTQKLLAAEPRGVAKPLYRHAPELVAARGVKVWFPIKAGLLRRTVGHVKAVRHADLTLRQGETLGVVGESGSGKSTLGLALLRLISSEGEITFDGRDLQALSGRQLRPMRKDIQIVFQDPYGSLSPRLSVAEIVGEGLDIHRVEGADRDRRGVIAQALSEVGLEPAMMDRYPHEFSGGQRQRIAIARALILKPKMMVLDEPTSALDMTVQSQIVDLLRALQEKYGMAYLFISHDLKVVRAMSHRIMVMRNGEIVEHGPAEDVVERPQTEYTRALMAAAFDLQASDAVRS